MNETTLRTPRVLVVEDEALIAEEIHDRLERLGYRVVGRADSAERAILAAAEARPDLVLMDIRLKGDLDGIAAAERIRQQLDVPVVYLTAHSDPATLQRARASAPFGYVLKPFQEKDLLVAIEMALQRHGVEQRLRESEARYATTLASIDDGVVATDLAGKVTFMNAVAERLTGWPLSDARGRPVEQVLVLRPEAERQAGAHPVKQVLEERAPVHLGEPTLLVDRAGTAFPLEDSAAPIVDTQGRMRGAVMAFRDGRPRRQAQESLRRMEDQLRHAQKMEAIGRLAGGVAHGFNNLITVILGNGELLLDSDLLDGRLAPRLHEIQRAGERAAELTRKLLTYSRRQVLAPEVVDLDQLVAEVEGLLRSLIGAEVELRRIGSAAPLFVRVDTGQIEQALLNLAVNARDAMPGGGTLTIETGRAEVEAEEAGGAAAPGQVLLRVCDTGVGMDRETLARLFEPFFTTKPAGIGTGLGLATVQGIVEQSGGRIRVDSAPGRGTTFTILLPEAHGPAAPRGVRPPAVEQPTGAGTILVAEDEEAVRAITTLTLRSRGYTVLSAAGAGEALQQFEGHRGPIELLVTDVLMPGMNGCELAERLASRAPSMRVLYVSGYADDVVVARSRGKLDFAFLQKPFTPSELLDKVRELLVRGEAGG